MIAATEKGSDAGTLTRPEVEDFLYAEAELLDEWRLPEWLDLFTDDATYQIPPTDIPADASPDNNLFYIADDRYRLGERVKRLMKRTAHAEYPHSKTRHQVSNVRILSQDDGQVEVACNFSTYRTKDDFSNIFFGKLLYGLEVSDGKIRIRSKRVVLDTNGLRNQGRISIIL
ncbi:MULTISPECIES: aromatic-ring-hydroxylating dioxygenase subunit beta [Rhodobacterales]|uniref:aromatic-ring-hydroxylating dioxygenase subunit beta n=1 Tax=Rhodobacterales TaxID=204455 RepID=UPI000EB5D57B|nr:MULTISPECIES: aromatic-ring-hydroxylating dioxygenase subunit beta [Rhodobacterales]MBO6884562.1 aromatic-ring-hydroxylating dioxygenase subunit beta [Marivita sp.]|tara:strand:+ start:4746 stop:5261 length:516 start_codon:yes stop_codon:yes gene_type:complete